MNTAAKLSAYGAALALLVAGAFATGSAVGPLTTADAAGHGGPRAGSAGHGDTHSGSVAETATIDLPATVPAATATATAQPSSPAPPHPADGHAH